MLRSLNAMRLDIVASALLLSCAVAAPSSLRAQGEIFWHESYQDALAEAKATGKPIFLEYRCEP